VIEQVWFVRLSEITGVVELAYSGSTLEDYQHSYVDIHTITQWCNLVLL
jgi:hypothetical protein